MAKSWNLHRVGDKPDWELTAKAKHNGWQRLAAKTGGIVTPGNLVSLLGLVLVLFGLCLLYTGELFWGFVLIGVGRAADVADGAVAQVTGTKSRLGEAVDATLDKVAILLALIVFVATGIVPLLAAGLMVLRNSLNISLSVAAKLQGQIIHPSQAGKFAGGLEWVTVLWFMAAALASEWGWGYVEATALVLAWVTLAMTLLLGAAAIKEYSAQVFRKI